MKRGLNLRRRSERGSAMLIVFVFAAIVAIMLYAELPIAVFEAKRQKEQLLIDRGNEYAHAVKLFVRKFGRYPASIDQLENTNRMRFLRHRFKDPFTGKDDWRLLHAGPGGMLIDSKVNPLGTPAETGANPPSSSGFGSGFGSANTSSNSTPAQSGFGSNSQDSNGESVVVPPLPQRPPAIPASAAPSTGASSGDVPAVPAEGDQSPATPLVTPAQTDQMAGNAGEPSPQASNTPAGQNAQTMPAPAAGAPMQPVGQSLNSRVQPTLLAGSTSSSGSTMGQINSGGIAGVASKAKGRSIKSVNDQTDYSLWEFYYDPTKDTMRGAPGQGLSGAQQGRNGMNPNSQTQTSFGQNSNVQTTPNPSSTMTSNEPSDSGTPPSNPPQQQ